MGIRKYVSVLVYLREVLKYLTLPSHASRQTLVELHCFLQTMLRHTTPIQRLLTATVANNR